MAFAPAKFASEEPLQNVGEQMPPMPCFPADTNIDSLVATGLPGHPAATHDSAHHISSHPLVPSIIEPSPYVLRTRTATDSSCSTLASSDAGVSEESRPSSASSQTHFPYTCYLSGTESGTMPPLPLGGQPDASRHDIRHQKALHPSLSWPADVKVDQLLADRPHSIVSPTVPFQTYQQSVSHQGQPLNASDRRYAWAERASPIVQGRYPSFTHQAKQSLMDLRLSSTAPYAHLQPYKFPLEQPGCVPLVSSLRDHNTIRRQQTVQYTGICDTAETNVRDGQDQLSTKPHMLSQSSHTLFRYPVAGMEQLGFSHKQTTLGVKSLYTRPVDYLQSQAMADEHGKYAQQSVLDEPEPGLYPATAGVEAPMSTIPSSSQVSIYKHPYATYHNSCWYPAPTSASPYQSPMPMTASPYLSSSTNVPWRGMPVQSLNAPLNLSEETTHLNPVTAAMQSAMAVASPSAGHSHRTASVALHWPSISLNTTGKEHPRHQQQRLQTSNPSLYPQRSITPHQNSHHRAVLHLQHDVSPSIPMTPLKHVGRHRSSASPYSKRKPTSPEYYYRLDLPTLPRFAGPAQAESQRAATTQTDLITGLGLIFPADIRAPYMPQHPEHGDMPTPAQSGSSINHKKAVEAVDKEQVQLPFTYPFSDLLPEAIRKDDDFESSPSAWHNPCSKDGDQNLGRMDMHSYTTLTEAEIELGGKQSEGCPKDTGVIFPTSSNEHYIPPDQLPVDLDAGPSQPASNAKSGADSVTTETDLPIREVYYCSFENCKRPFKRLEHRRRHERIHTLEKPYGCDFPGCGRFFSRSDNLGQHKRTHCQPAVPSSRAHLARAAHHSARP